MTDLVMIEALCQREQCGEVTYSDEFYINTKGEIFSYRGECYECGLDTLGEWKISEQPHPELFV